MNRGVWVAILSLGIAWAVMLLFGGMEFDRGLLLFLYRGGDARAAAIARWLGEIGRSELLVALTGIGAGWLLVRREVRSAFFLIAVTLSGRLLVSMQRDWTAPIRPDAQSVAAPTEAFAFPSGHAANATMVLLCLALLVPPSERARTYSIWAAVWLAILAGIGRLILGLQWPSDVIAGWAFGLLWTLLLLHLSGLRVNEGTPAAPAHFAAKEAADERREQEGRDSPRA